MNSELNIRKFVAMCVDDYGQSEEDRAEGFNCLFRACGLNVEATEAEDTDLFVYKDKGVVFRGVEASRANLLLTHIMTGMPGSLENQQRFDHVREKLASFVSAKEISLGVIKG